LKQVLVLLGITLFLAPALHAQEECPVEVKLLLAPLAAQTAIESLPFQNETRGRVYLFDTDSLELMKQGVTVRVRQGATNDLTVKVRLPEDTQRVDDPGLRERFPCEVDRTRAGAYISYAVVRKYKATKALELGNDIYSLLSASQLKLIHEAQVSIDWGRVKQIGNINLTQWNTAAQSPSGKLTLELWEWPLGRILELSAKVGSEAEASKYAELERLAKMNNLGLSASQDTKTSIVLKTFIDHASPPK
jgi:hypothetical protein